LCSRAYKENVAPISAAEQLTSYVGRHVILESRYFSELCLIASDLGLAIRAMMVIRQPLVADTSIQ
jgi:hypothetical protein